MSINSKNKGNTFERKIANILSKRFESRTGLKHSFRRSESSGSFFGGKNVVRIETHDTEKATFGDIITPNDFRYTIECKHYKTAPSFNLIMNQNVPQWDEWIEQAILDANSAKKLPMIIVKYNKIHEFVILQNPTIGHFLLYKTYYLNSLENVLKYYDAFFFDNLLSLV